MSSYFIEATTAIVLCVDQKDDKENHELISLLDIAVDGPTDQACVIRYVIVRLPPRIASQSHRLLYIFDCVGLSFNQPMISACTVWHSDAITFTNSNTIIGAQPSTVFVTVDNTILVTSTDRNRLVEWFSPSALSPDYILGNLTQPKGLFVSSTGDVYVDNGFALGRVEAWPSNATQFNNSWNVNGSCFALFLVHDNTLYCSLGSLHRVVNISLAYPSTSPSTVAGSGVNGSSSDMLRDPHGIFVTPNTLDLYVADSGNDRIQMFAYGRLNGTTVAGAGAPGTVSLNQPRAVILDAAGVLFIVDTMSHRIVTSWSHGFRCIAGCAGTSGSTSSKLNTPVSLSFDRDGNLLVVDQGNARIQNFSVARNSCGKCSSLSTFEQSMRDMSRRCSHS